ncbi:Nitrogenase molybdenum-iron protein, alpha and beta chains [Sporobacter termitidis DSM 10068]|uniref:Nitrogenase molybdenum-iron protein, alpha and beta chains n=1 Tax=Sporobacter termitidis DSM 10068 TaxID=1123282 RepID=A0A1M5YQT9_9FIRM|nr:nitrogenase component 1 [Sporobacter termitidis]SHI14224.1 Nitrogenase molybdenum-iron protein, alpha and beta chains [Sporobacter termitidis DSM 10068]
MSGYLDNITPDSFSGIIFALEGVARTIVLLNGPTGCKFYHSATSDNQTIRQFEFDPLNYPEKWYFGQPRVPCTYLDSSDYIYGSRDKLTEALEFLRDNVSFELLCIVNSPGAALIGDDLRGIAAAIIQDRPVVVVETPGFSRDICAGHETAALELLKQLPLRQADEKAPKTVNLLGLSVFHRNYTGDIAELRRLLALCGIAVNCPLCAGGDLESVKNLPNAALNIVIHPDYGLRTAENLNAQYGMPFYVCDGPPVGFAATEKLLREICVSLGADASPAIAESERARARAYAFISRVNSLTGLPKGVTFSVEGTYSELYAYTDFLVRYFGMIPSCLSVLSAGSDCFKDRLRALLDKLGVSDALDRDILETDSELVLASGNTIAKLKLKKHAFSGIEISLPSLGYVDVIPKTHLGIQGALLLTEQIVNGLMF